MLPDFTGTSFSLVLWELRDLFNFRSQFLKFGVIHNFFNRFQSILFNLMAKATYIRTV